MEHIVIIGTGQGGFQVAASLRQQGFEGRVTLIGDEPELPYQRPPLSKEFLKEGDAARLLLRPAGFYQQNRIEVIISARVNAIDRAAMTIETAHGQRIGYDHLVLATGSRNRVPPIQGLDRAGVLALRDIADAENIRHRAEKMQHALVIGGGFIGLEFTAFARMRGIKVTVIEGADRLMGRAVSPATSQYFLDAHSALGAKVVLGQFAESINVVGGLSEVILKDGSAHSGDAVILAAGVVANDEVAGAAGLAINDGIVVDDLMRSSDPNISALGDCCRFVEPISGLSARLESVQAATDQARTIAARLTGKPAPYAAVPWFWSNQGDLRLQIAGYGPDADDWHVEQADDKLTVFGFAGGRLAAVETVNNAGIHMATRKLFATQGRVPRDLLKSNGYDLKAMLASPTK